MIKMKEERFLLIREIEVDGKRLKSVIGVYNNFSDLWLGFKENAKENAAREYIVSTYEGKMPDEWLIITFNKEEVTRFRIW